MIQLFKKVITGTLDWFVYTVLSEKQKTRLANLFTDQQKARIKQITKFGKKHTQKQYVKKLKDHLYTLGFTTKALRELQDVYQSAKDPYLKRLVAWELLLWFANQYTIDGAKEALHYIQAVETGEKDRNQLRRIAIMKAECLDRIGQNVEAKQVITSALEKEIHPDLYFARVNLEKMLSDRLPWMNKVYTHYNLNPITFTTPENPTYDDLKVATHAEKVKRQEKVTVILPAFNAEAGIQIAVESILSQTWENLELLIVDDCSSDNTIKVARKYAENDHRVKVFQAPKNGGPYIARNIALQHATGDFVTINDADDWSHEKKLEIQALHLISNPQVIANTSAHARLTEDLFVYRRGTPGRYIFPNMSSIMFRREQVTEKLGFCDSVRFAADGEFKRRLLRVFGEASYVDLESGPLSLPRQSVSSLTSSSAFGYNGFFMGVRKEYVESLEYYHHHHQNLYYPYPMEKRPFPVPEPMWPEREEKQDGKRSFDCVIAADFRGMQENDVVMKQLMALKKRKPHARIGLVQLYHYHLETPMDITSPIRELIDGNQVQILVYGEKINTEKLLIMDYTVMVDEQKYCPTLFPEAIAVLVEEVTDPNAMLAIIHQHIDERFGKKSSLLPVNKHVEAQLKEKFNDVLISNEDWVFTDGK